MEDNRPLFDIEDLRKLDFDDTEGVKFNPLITQNDPGENLLVRPLQRGDFNHGMLYVSLSYSYTVGPQLQNGNLI